jgi:hypothetical protein
MCQSISRDLTRDQLDTYDLHVMVLVVISNTGTDHYTADTLSLHEFRVTDARKLQQLCSTDYSAAENDFTSSYDILGCTIVNKGYSSGHVCSRLIRVTRVLQSTSKFEGVWIDSWYREWRSSSCLCSAGSVTLFREIGKVQDGPHSTG